MSGVIKFRVWDEKRKAYTYAPDEFSSSLGPYFLTLDGRIYIDGVFQKHLLLEQSTGLLDRNGKEIYEGDILFLNGKTFEVVSCGYAYKLMETMPMIQMPMDEYISFFIQAGGAWGDNIFVKVFGNIHEEDKS
jgi:hypothetical protein